MKNILVITLLAITTSAPTFAGEYSGVPKIIDANTIMINYKRIKLHAINPLNENQTCKNRGKEWRCGWEAANALINMVGRHWVTCQETKELTQNEISANCYIGNNINLSAWMIRNGWGTINKKEGSHLYQIENLARQEGRGIWK